MNIVIIDDMKKEAKDRLREQYQKIFEDQDFIDDCKLQNLNHILICNLKDNTFSSCVFQSENEVVVAPSKYTLKEDKKYRKLIKHLHGCAIMPFPVFIYDIDKNSINELLK